MTEALQIIWREHAQITQVLEILDRIVGDAADPLDTPRLHAILDYMEGFADSFHHPKEEHYLLPALLRRKPDLALLAQQVQEEHDQAIERFAELRRTLDTCAGNPGAAAAFREMAAAYSEFQKRHMAREDQGLLPIALEILTDDDWLALNAAFTREADPLIGTARQAEFTHLFQAIVEAPQKA